MSHLVRKSVLGFTLLLLCGSVLADCDGLALEGDWTVFYRDNGFPTSVLDPNETIHIAFDQNTKQFSLELTDSTWKAWNGIWQAECINGQAFLLGAIQKRRGATTLVVEISRVTRTADLLRNASGVVKQRQINIRFPQPFAAHGLSGDLATLAEHGLLTSHPGHAHGFD